MPILNVPGVNLELEGGNCLGMTLDNGVIIKYKKDGRVTVQVSEEYKYVHHDVSSSSSSSMVFYRRKIKFIYTYMYIRTIWGRRIGFGFVSFTS